MKLLMSMHLVHAVNLACRGKSYLRIKVSLDIRVHTPPSKLRHFPCLDHGLSVVPTKEWQDGLSDRLASKSFTQSSNSEGTGGHTSQRRRVGHFSSKSEDWDKLYKIETPTDGNYLCQTTSKPPTDILQRTQRRPQRV